MAGKQIYGKYSPGPNMARPILFFPENRTVMITIPFFFPISRGSRESNMSAYSRRRVPRIAADSEPASAGIALCKDTIHLGVSISDGALGLYISFAS